MGEINEIKQSSEVKTTGGYNGGDNILSNQEYINEEMDNLINNLNGSIDYYEKHSSSKSFNSSEEKNQLYSRMNDIMSEYSLAQKNLMEKLKREAKFVKYTGETYAQLDKSMQGDAEKL